MNDLIDLLFSENFRENFSGSRLNLLSFFNLLFRIRVNLRRLALFLSEFLANEVTDWLAHCSIAGLNTLSDRVVNISSGLFEFLKLLASLIDEFTNWLLNFLNFVDTTLNGYCYEVPYVIRGAQSAASPRA